MVLQQCVTGWAPNSAGPVAVAAVGEDAVAVAGAVAEEVAVADADGVVLNP